MTHRYAFYLALMPLCAGNTAQSYAANALSLPTSQGALGTGVTGNTLPGVAGTSGGVLGVTGNMPSGVVGTNLGGLGITGNALSSPTAGVGFFRFGIGQQQPSGSQQQPSGSQQTGSQKAAQTGSVPVSACTTISGVTGPATYTLTSDLSHDSNAGPCILINNGTNNVTFDCNGHALNDSNNAFPGYILKTDLPSGNVPNNVTIKNCSGDGRVELGGSSITYTNINLTNATPNTSTAAIFFVHLADRGWNNRIDGVTITADVTSGCPTISACGTSFPLWADGQTNLVVTNYTCTGTGTAFAVDTDNCLILNQTATGPITSNVTISGIVATNTANGAIEGVGNWDRVTLAGNTFHASRFGFIAAYGPAGPGSSADFLMTNCTVQNNTCDHCRDQLFYITEGNHSYVGSDDAGANAALGADGNLFSGNLFE